MQKVAIQSTRLEFAIQKELKHRVWLATTSPGDHEPLIETAHDLA